jgi:hypothetical protein
MILRSLRSPAWLLAQPGKVRSLAMTVSEQQLFRLDDPGLHQLLKPYPILLAAEKAAGKSA